MPSRKLVIAAASAFIAVSAGAALTFVVTRPAPEPQVPAFVPRQTSPQESHDLERYADMTSLKLALSAHFAAKNGYPAALAELAPQFVAEVPADPGTGEPYLYELVDGAFRIGFTLEHGVLGLSPGPHALVPGGFDVPPTRPAITLGGEKVTIVSPEGTVAPAPQETAPASPVPQEPAIDTDNDGIPDDIERRLFGTDPEKTDTDGDGFDDLKEVRAGYDPTKLNERLPDADGDGLADLYETFLGTRADLADTDGDGAGDGAEVLTAHTDPLAKN